MRLRTPIVLATMLALGILPVSPALAQQAGAPQVTGILIVDHGEPPQYNELTYWSFRAFFDHLMEMEVIPSWLKLLDAGTILQDSRCYGCGPEVQGDLIDAWLRPHDAPASYVPPSDRLPGHHVMAGGPGLGEPDIFEHMGLSAWDEWRRMGGRSPNYEEKLPKKLAAIESLEQRYRQRVAIRVGYGIDPRIGGAHQGIRQAVEALVNRDRVDRLVVAYHGVGFSDIMQTHMLRHDIHETLEDLGAGDLPVRYTDPMGTTNAYVSAIVKKARRELLAVPGIERVALHLSGHGLSSTMCGEYDCGADAYHRFSKALFDRTRAAILETIGRPGLGVFHIYGDGGEGDADPDDLVRGPIEALDQRVAEGFDVVIDIPYEFDSNSRDTLIVLRRGYGRTPPDWNRSLESHFEYRGLAVKIANASGGLRLKTRALERVITRSLEGWAEPVQEGGVHAQHHAA